MRFARLLGVVVMTCWPAFAAGAFAQAAGPSGDDLLRSSVAVAAGAHAWSGGSAVSASYGFSVARHLTLLLNVERLHLPTETEQHEDVFSATRGGTLTFVTGEARVHILGPGRVSPYVLGGVGRGASQPNVNETFPDPVESTPVGVIVGGAGVRVPIGRRVEAFADARFVFHVGLERDDLSIAYPVRGGVAWRF